MPRKFHKHKLLLDEDIKHITADFKQKGLPDLDVYKLASKERRLVVTYNVNDFKNLLVREANTGIIGVSPNLTLEQIDKKLTSLLIKATQKQLFGKFTYISGESES
jgi:hypothetical protein